MRDQRYSFQYDYSEGAHPRILDALVESNMQQELGYGEDTICEEACEFIHKYINNPKAAIHFVSGGTQANLLVIASILRPHEAVIAARSGHIATHEAGAIEATGHKICTIDANDGKLTPELIDNVCKAHTTNHMVKPRLVYISNSTEIGTIYNKTELQNIATYCRENKLYFFIDGARLGSALASDKSDMTMSEFASFPDIFYIGGTKNGGLIGEAIVINNEEFARDFRYIIKQRGAMLAKSRVIGVQFRELFRDNLFFELAEHANCMAGKIAQAIKVAGYKFHAEQMSNQLFPILPNTLIEQLTKKFLFFQWGAHCEDTSIVRIVTSWATKEEQVDAFIEEMKLFA